MLYERIKKYKERGMSSFHTPGHKGQKIFQEDIWSIDLTELPDTDSLYDASGIILQSENAVSKIFGSKKSLISGGGNTLCIQTMIKLASDSRKTFVSGRNVHRCAVATMALLDIQPKWIAPCRDSGIGLPGRIRSEDVAKALEEMKSSASVYITSPDYYGVICDIKSISQECKLRDSILIVDNAHGTHLKFLEKSLHPLDLGATMSADSAHKTLPVLTGGAWLHINDDKMCDESKQAMALFGSTSPSYPIMCSLDWCAGYLKDKGFSEFYELEKKTRHLKKVAQEKGFITPQSTCDPTRITLSPRQLGHSADEFTSYLRTRNIEPEFSCENYVVLIASPFNTSFDWERLERAVLEIEPKDSLNFIQRKNSSLPEVKMRIREALFAKHERVSIKNSIGRVAGDIVCPCPPGVPVVMPGEVIGEAEKEALEVYGIYNIDVVK